MKICLGLTLGILSSGMAIAQEDIAANYTKALNLIQTGDYQNALKITNSMIAQRRGKKEAADASIHDLHGIALLQTKQVPEAVKILEQGQKIFEGLKASEQKGYPNLMMNLSVAYRMDGKFDAAEKNLLKLLELAKKPRAEKPLWMVQREMANLYEDKKDIDKAMTLIGEALKNYKGDAGTLNPADEVGMYEIQTDLLTKKNRLPEAAEAATKLAAVARRAFGPADPQLANALKTHGMALMQLSKIKEAQVPLTEAAAIYQKQPQTDDIRTFSPLLNTLTALAWAKVELNDLREAEANLLRARAIIEKHPNTHVDDLDYWHRCSTHFYSTMKDMPKAVSHAEQRVAVNEKAYGKDHPSTVSARKELAVVYQSAGRKDLAQKINDTNAPAAPTTGFDRMTEICDEGWKFYHKGDYVSAEKNFTQLYQQVIKELGPEHPAVATALIGLINTSEAKGDRAKVETIYTRLGTFMRSHDKKLNSRVEGDSYEALATIAEKLQKPDEAKVWAAKWYVSYAELLDGVLSAGTQEQRLDFTSKWQPYSLFTRLNDSRALATMVLRLKGVVMDSLLEERQQAIFSKDPKHRQLFTELTQLKEQYRKLSFADDEESQKQALAIRTQLDAKEQQMAGIGTASSSGLTRRALRVKVEDVQAKLPPGSLLIEFIRYNDKMRQPSYGAILIPPSGPSKWVPIGQATELDRIVEFYKVISNHFGNPSMMEAASKQLQTKLFAPIEKQFPEGTKRLIISPDSELCFISFATLLDDKNQFLCEKYDLQYVASGRDLLRQPYKGDVEKSKDSMTIFADPTYLTGTTGNTGPRWLAQLPGAKEEGRILKEEAESWKWKVDLLIDDKASEAAIRSMQAPRILHLSTHGFYFDHMPHPGKQDQEANPMLKSGLALAGAETAFRKWSTGKFEDPSQDGILMADELGDLNLRGTWLVCLSACQTGSGEAKSGEGVMGLRRGFIEAGAQHLISTLWPIPDAQTVPVMKDFYARVNETQDPPLAMSQVQRDWLVKLRKEHNSPGAAIILVGAFIANSYGKPGS